ncbi:MAG: thioredoxin-dependent thiol peroxidase [Hyphomonadaceae bacterium]|nr:thioredoxin-dependent thiol peroxidase [Hyphomonadaceae bacterium]
MVEEGVTAPEFSLPGAGDTTLTLSEFAGKWVVVYFYPKDNTPGCTNEAKDFSALASEFAARNAVIIGISKDSVKKHDNFRAKHELTVELASDESGEVCEAYGVWVEKKLYGKTYMGIQRATFLVAPDGKIAKTWPKVRVAGHAQAVLAEIPAE